MAFHGKVALVTGAASGMGRVAALRLANAGAKVAAVDLDPRALERLACESANIHTHVCDVSNLEAVEALDGIGFGRE